MRERRVVPPFRSSRAVSATSFGEFRRVMITSKLTILVAHIELKFLGDLAACGAGTSDRRYSVNRRPPSNIGRGAKSKGFEHHQNHATRALRGDNVIANCHKRIVTDRLIDR